ncbi:unnamed protein product [Pleuronectes platessa]|uniref:Uncharacterized protein n=1 Tax=Pleuronectes platessa TaxID=8262 RepID=A0A9N7YTC1_PLEPL|nr:unnamed protein product [Pleuronectes platessa]
MAAAGSVHRAPVCWSDDLTSLLSILEITALVFVPAPHLGTFQPHTGTSTRRRRRRQTSLCLHIQPRQSTERRRCLCSDRVLQTTEAPCDRGSRQARQAEQADWLWDFCCVTEMVECLTGHENNERMGGGHEKRVRKEDEGEGDEMSEGVGEEVTASKSWRPRSISMCPVHLVERSDFTLR